MTEIIIQKRGSTLVKRKTSTNFVYVKLHLTIARTTYFSGQSVSSQRIFHFGKQMMIAGAIISKHCDKCSVIIFEQNILVESPRRRCRITRMSFISKGETTTGINRFTKMCNNEF